MAILNSRNPGASLSLNDLIHVVDIDDPTDDPANGTSKKFTIQQLANLITSTVDTFVELTDTPANYSGAGDYLVKVNAGATALEFTNPATYNVSNFNNDAGYLTSLAFTGLTDTPANYVGAGLQVVRVNAGETALEFATISAGATNYLGLTDTPGAYTGDAGKFVLVNGTPDGLEHVAASSINISGFNNDAGYITTNLTHTGEVTGAATLTVDKTAITNKTTVTAVSGDFVLISDTSDTGNLKKADVADFLLAGASGLNDLTDVTLTGVAQGDVLFRNATGWVNLGPGTNGQVLTSGGAGANVSWTTPAGGSDGNGIYDGNGTVPTTTVSTLTDTWNITGGDVGIGIAPTEKLQVAGNIKTAAGDILQSGGTLNVLENNVKVGAGTFGALTAGRGIHATGGAGFFRIGDLTGTDAGFWVNAGTINFGTLSTDDLLIYVGNSIKGRLKTGSTGQLRWGTVNNLSASTSEIELGGTMAFRDDTSDPGGEAGVCKIYSKDVAGTVKLFAQDSAGTVTQLST